MVHPQTSTDYSVDTPSTSASMHYPNRYHDVFISHRGADVKKTFAHRLYHRLLSHRLQPFLDKDELHKGEYIHPQLEGAIRTASVHIAIFSPGYADSRWCLDELLRILNKSNSGDTIIPVFYNVKPSDLRWTTGPYAEALNNHEKKGRCDNQTLENWRNALKEVSYIVGFELEVYIGDEDKLLEDVLGCVLKKRRKTPLYVADYPTGLQLKVEDFEKTVLSQQQRNVKALVLGIVGLGGVGKTTLAKELFNRMSCDFNKSSFLYDVRETVSLSSLNSLQSTLLKDLTKRTDQVDSTEKGIEILREFLSSLHALIVLDDVDRVNQLHAILPITDVLHPDSFILVTSRDNDVLIRSGIPRSSIYTLKGLNDQHSQQLFCSHAFLQPDPLPGFENLVDEFCKACDALPLSLRVFGALLCGKNDQSYWTSQLDKLLQIKLPNEIQETLKISYDALEEEEERQIFLDIACYFIGEDKDMAVRIWDGSGWKGLVGLRNLQDKCLVQVDKKNTIKMHDHLRDLGRQIADQQKSSGVSPHRLWRLIEDIPDFSHQYSVITEVRGIRTVSWFDSWDHREGSSWLKGWLAEVLGNCLRKLINPSPYRFSKLQLVAAENDDLESILRRVESPNLIWLRWKHCSYACLPPWIPIKNTRVLEVSGYKLKTLWRAESQAPLELRELTVSCRFFSKFPRSIGQLKYIEKIVVKGSNLKSLPEEFGYLCSLKYLDLCGSRLLQMLPNSFGYLTNLQHLDLRHSQKLHMLPNSFGSLTNLQYLNIHSSGLKMLPNSFGNLIRLKHLDLPYLYGVSHETFSNIRSLEHLRLGGALEVLPPQVALQQSLVKLFLFPTRLQELPWEIGNLSSLEELMLGSPFLKILPCSLGHLSSLKKLILHGCEGLKSLPNSLGLLTQLSELGITDCGIQSLPPEVVKLNNLVKLTVKKCQISELPLKKWVEGESVAIELSRLELFQLEDTKISEVSFIDGVCPTLKELEIQNCDDLVEVRALPPTLRKLSLVSCKKLRKIEGLCNLTKLQELDIGRCVEVEELPGLERLTSLERFEAEVCYKLKRIRGLEALTQLQRLNMRGCHALEELASVEDLLELRWLDIRSCPKLQSGRGVLNRLRQRLGERLKEDLGESSSCSSGDEEKT